jgi:hypothetical protein
MTRNSDIIDALDAARFPTDNRTVADVATALRDEVAPMRSTRPILRLRSTPSERINPAVIGRGRP